MTHSKNKGSLGEREAAALLKEFGFNAHRSQQFMGKHGDQDLTHDMEGFHVEVKRTERSNFYSWLAQAAGDAKNGNVPFVLHRKNRKDWVVIIDARVFLKLITDYVFEG